MDTNTYLDLRQQRRQLDAQFEKVEDLDQRKAIASQVKAISDRLRKDPPTVDQTYLSIGVPLDEDYSIDRTDSDRTDAPAKKGRGKNCNPAISRRCGNSCVSLKRTKGCKGDLTPEQKTKAKSIKQKITGGASAPVEETTPVVVATEQAIAPVDQTFPDTYDPTKSEFNLLGKETSYAGVPQDVSNSRIFGMRSEQPYWGSYDAETQAGFLDSVAVQMKGLAGDSDFVNRANADLTKLWDSSSQDAKDLFLQRNANLSTVNPALKAIAGGNNPTVANTPKNNAIAPERISSNVLEPSRRGAVADQLNEWSSYTKSQLANDNLDANLKTQLGWADNFLSSGLPDEVRSGRFANDYDYLTVGDSKDLQAFAVIPRGTDGYVKIDALMSNPRNITGENRVSGSGSRAIAQAVLESKNRGFEGRVRLSPIPSAIGFYQKLGFEKLSGNTWELSSDAAQNLLSKLGIE